MKFAVELILIVSLATNVVHLLPSPMCGNSKEDDCLYAHVTCDNELTVYADGKLLRNISSLISPPGATEEWQNSRTFAVPDETCVVGIKCRDLHSVGGIIGDFGRVVTDGSWVCNTKFEHGWNTASIVSSDWKPATTIGQNGIQPWGQRQGISGNANWIWTSGWKGQDKEVYCRKVLNGNHCDEEITSHATCDNQMTLYADGHVLPNVSSLYSPPGATLEWQNARTYVVPEDTCVVGIKCLDVNTDGGIIGDFGRVVTDGSWFCSNKYEHDWNTPGFVPNGWVPATVIGSNGMQPWGVRQGISPNANWIWTPGWNGQDKEVYCRRVMSNDCDEDIFSHATCDSELTLYADGHVLRNISSLVSPPCGTEEWQNSRTFVVSEDTCVVGIKCRGSGVAGGIIGDFGRIVTDGSWVCNNKFEQGWNTDRSVSNDWKPATVIGKNGIQPWGQREGISANADWIWTPGWNGQDKEVYCRKVLHNDDCFEPDVV